MARGSNALGICRRKVGWVASLLAVAELPCAIAWRTWGVLPVEKSFVQYVGKFCFDYSLTQEAGEFEFTIEGLVEEGALPKDAPPPQVQPASPCWGPCDPTGGLYLVVYDDEKAHWRAAQKDWYSLTCKERLADASWAKRISPLPATGYFNRTVFVAEKIRPRFWYFSFVACDVEAFIKPVEYTIHAENILMDWERELGVDQEGCLILQLLFLVLFVGLCFFLRLTAVSSGSVAGESFRARPLLRLLVMASICSAGGCALMSVHYAFYLMDGVGMPILEVLAVIIAALSKANLTVLTLLTAKGWVLFYSPHEIARRRFTVCTLGGIVIASALCEIHGQYFHDWRTTLYMYESGPGLFILFLNIVLFAEAARSMYQTYSHEVSAEVREFYRTLAGAIGVYYLMLPIICIMSGLFSPWVRRKYVARTELIARFASMVLFTYCLRPARLDVIINSRLEDGMDSDLCYSENEEMEECGFVPDNDGEASPLTKDGMAKLSQDDTE